MCAPGDNGEWRYVVDIVYGTYHQIGVAAEGCCSGITTGHNSVDLFACLYSHSTGWDRHMGSAVPVGTPSAEEWWSGTWDGPQQLDVTVKCTTNSFIVGIVGGDPFLGEMKWDADAWSAGVYPFTGEQSGSVHDTVTLKNFTYCT